MKRMNLKFYEENVPYNAFSDNPDSYADVVLWCNENGDVYHIVVVDNKGRAVFDKENDFVNVAVCRVNGFKCEYNIENGKPFDYGCWIPLLENLFDWASYPQDSYEDLLELCDCYNDTWPAFVEYCKGY